MEYSPKSKYIDLPHSAYRWVLLDSAEQFEDKLFAVYEHDDVDSWCVLKKSKVMNSINVFILSEEDVPAYVETDMECLINLLTNSINYSSTFVIKPSQNGTVADAYNSI